jgi:hypothetical protein
MSIITDLSAQPSRSVDPNPTDTVSPLGNQSEASITPTSSSKSPPDAFEIGDKSTSETHPSPADTPAFPNIPPEPKPAADLGLPDISEMETELNRNGVLLPDLYVKPVVKEQIQSPLAALQPGHLQGQEEITTPPENPLHQHLNGEVQLANSGEVKVPLKPNAGHSISIPFWVGFVGLLLIELVQAIVQTWHFVVAIFPQLEKLVIMNHISQTEMNMYTYKALALGGSAVVTLIMILILIMGRKMKSKIILYVLSAALILANIYIQNVFVQPFFASGNPINLPQIIQEIQSPPEIDAARFAAPILEIKPN